MARPSKIERVLLDASALIGVIQGDADFECLKPMLAAVDNGSIVLVESTAILAEVLSAHPKDPAGSNARALMRSLLEDPKTELVDVSTAVARKAGDLRVDLGMATWDAVHLATAIIAKVDVLVARDGKFPEGDYEGVFVSKPFDIDDDKLPLS